jgi:membrane fusion protein, multidrug efflux system
VVENLMVFMQKNSTILLISLCSILLFSCGKSDKTHEKSDKKEAKATFVTVTKVNNQTVETTQVAIGSLEGLISPTVGAEVAGQVLKFHVVTGEQVKAGQLIATLDASDFGMQRKEQQAEIARIQAQIDNQAKTVERSQVLVNKNFISKNAVDNDVAQQTVLQHQLDAAKARMGSINHDSNKTRVVAPVSGVVEKRLVSQGEFVRIGDPIVQIVSKQKLRAHLPFPEQIAAQFKAGLKVRLTTPTSDKAVETAIHELKPMVTEGSRSIDIIADIPEGAPGWQPGASVTGTIVLGKSAAAMMIPEQSLILRPAGEVVYVVRDNMAYQAVVKTGFRQNGLIEIVEGLQENDEIAVDGAGFLTDKTPVKVAPTTLLAK